MKISRNKLRRLIEMAVRQDILDAAAKQPDKRTILMNTKLDINKLDQVYQSGYGQTLKPDGLWYGFGTNWIDFVRNPANKGLIDRYTKPEYFYNIDVKTITVDDLPVKSNHQGEEYAAAVLVLRSHNDIQKLMSIYPNFRIVRAGGMFLANWMAISFHFGGLEISDAIATYFGWDVASGCVWDKNAITSIQTLQSPETTQNIPRGAAALGVSLGFNPDAQTINGIGNQEIIEHLEEYEEDYEYEGYFESQLASSEYADDDYYKDIYHKLYSILDSITGENPRDNPSWVSEAIDGGNPYRSNFSVLGAAICLLHYYDQNTNGVGGANSIIYNIDRSKYDLGDALENINQYLQDVSDLYGLGIKNIDLDHDDAWDNARSSIEAMDY